MIYLRPEVRSGLGEDTFWTWFNREIPSSFDANEAKPGDLLLQYATLGAPNTNAKSVALAWELYPEMKAQGIAGDFDAQIAKMRECAAACTKTCVTSPLMLEYFPGADVMPIGVDTELFTPMDQAAMREKHGIAKDAFVGFWCGTTHHMKGKERLHAYQLDHPEMQWIVRHKEDTISQSHLAELMNCADFTLFTGRLRPYFMVEWEAMACDLFVRDISGMERDFTPSAHPREDVIAQGWSRTQAREQWLNYAASI